MEIKWEINKRIYKNKIECKKEIIMLLEDHSNHFSKLDFWKFQKVSSNLSKTHRLKQTLFLTIQKIVIARFFIKMNMYGAFKALKSTTNKHFIFLKLNYYVLNTLISILTPDLGQQNINKLYILFFYKGSIITVFYTFSFCSYLTVSLLHNCIKTDESWLLEIYISLIKVSSNGVGPKWMQSGTEKVLQERFSFNMSKIPKNLSVTYHLSVGLQI